VHPFIKLILPSMGEDQWHHRPPLLLSPVFSDPLKLTSPRLCRFGDQLPSFTLPSLPLPSFPRLSLEDAPAVFLPKNIGEIFFSRLLSSEALLTVRALNVR